jgi:uncharacterized caspase-like protein
MVGYATAHGGVALAAKGTRNSPYTTALLHHIADAGVDITTVMQRVRKEGAAATKGRQVPWASSSFNGEVILAK